MEEMIALEPIASADGLNIGRYGRLLAKFAPKVIETEAENEAALAIVESLMKKGDDGRSHEEEALLELLVSLVEQFEKTEYDLPEGTPLGALEYLMESNGLKAIELAPIFGGRGRVSDVLSGRRAISKEQAKRLGERFHVSPAVFI
jgi:HTH-type transcriptional regulator/antitoxin HigA